MTEEATAVEETPPPAEMQTGAPAESTDSAPVESADTAAKAPEKSGMQKRIDELIWKQREAERKAEYWQQQAESKQPESAPKPVGKPTLDQFDDYDGYVEALAGFQAKETFAAMQEQESRSRMQAEQASRTQGFRQKAEVFSVEHPDFQQVVFENRYLPITEQMKEVIETSEKGPDLAYHLGSNPQEAARIANLSPVMAAMELGKIEATLSIPKGKPVSDAPPPITPVGGGESSVKDPSRMSIEEFMAWRNSNLTG